METHYYEAFRDLHRLQYDRIAQLETQENFVSNFVTGLSTLIIGYTFSQNPTVRPATGLILSLVWIVCNVTACLFIWKTRSFIKTHQARAKKMRQHFVPDIQQIYESVEKKDSEKDIFKRRNQIIALHSLIALAGLYPVYLYLR